MKKIITSAAMGSLFFAAAMADQAVVTAQEEQPVVVEEACDTACDQSSFGGLSFMLGVSGNFFKVKETDSYFKSKNVNRFMGTLGIGFGKVFNNKFYAGIEALCDFTKSKKYTPEAGKDWGGDLYEEGELIGNGRIKAHGIMPNLGLRFGYVFPNCNTMVYAKVGAVYARLGLGNVDNNVVTYKNKSKVAPAFALGVEKAFSKKFSARLEGEYMVNAKPKFAVDDNQEIKMKVNGFNVRALISYNVNL